MKNGIQNKNFNTTCLRTLIHSYSLKILNYNKMVQKLDHSFKINIHIAQFHYSTLKLDVACTVAALSFKNGYTVKNESFLKAYSSHE